MMKFYSTGLVNLVKGLPALDPEDGLSCHPRVSRTSMFRVSNNNTLVPPGASQDDYERAVFISAGCELGKEENRRDKVQNTGAGL